MEEFDVFEGLHDQRKVAMNTIVETGINEKIYDQGDITDLVESIQEHGMLQPLKVIKNGDGKHILVSGHRRLLALKKLFKEDDLLIPVTYVPAPPTPSLEFLTEMIIEHNRYRVKTKEELIREGRQLEEVMSAKAGKRMISGDPDAKGPVRDVVGEQIGMSGKSYSEGKRVLEQIEEVEKEDPELAEKARNRFKKSISGASRILNEKETPGDIRREEMETEYAYWPVLQKLIRVLYKDHELLKKFRNHTSSQEFANLIGNIADFAELLETWNPERVKANGPGWNKASKK